MARATASSSCRAAATRTAASSSSAWCCRPRARAWAARCVRLLKQMAFRDLHAHRFWLDVKSLNTRALALYASEGFVEEGRLRESVRITGDAADGYDSLDRDEHARPRVPGARGAGAGVHVLSLRPAAARTAGAAMDVRWR